jgi:glycosyltransferase involved in cell wall biosynthesis
MKILVVQDYLRSGGTERQSVLLSQAFAEAGHETHLLTFRPGGSLRPAESSPLFSLPSLQKRDLGLDWWAPGLRRHAQAFQPRIILCMGRMANCYGASLQRAVPSAAVISTLRTGKKLPFLFRRSLQRTRHVIANSQAARQHLINVHRLSADHISVIPNGLVFPPRDDLPAAQREREELRQQWDIGADEIVLVDVAMFRPEKNHRALIDVAARLDPSLPWRLCLVGDGPSRADCAKHAAELGLADQVIFPGWFADPRPFYAMADIAVHASRRESLSNFLIEAQAHGLPVVATAARGVDETFRDGESGFLIAPGDLDDFARAVTALLADPACRSRMARTGESHARQAFSTATQVKAHLDLFAKLASLGSPA